MAKKPESVVVRDYRLTDDAGVALRVSRKKKIQAWSKAWLNRPGNRQHQLQVQKLYRGTAHGRAIFLAKAAKRRASKMAATPTLTAADHLRINALYAEAARRTAETGIVHHVDHDVPLALGGKHHPDNLLVVPARLNLSKGARYASTWEFIVS